MLQIVELFGPDLEPQGVVVIEGALHKYFPTAAEANHHADISRVEAIGLIARLKAYFFKEIGDQKRFGIWATEGAAEDFCIIKDSDDIVLQGTYSIEIAVDVARTLTEHSDLDDDHGMKI